MRTLLILPFLLSSCAMFSVNGDRKWGSDRVDEWVDEFSAEACRVFSPCDDVEAVGTCDARSRTSMSDHDSCRFDRSAAASCLVDLQDMTCGSEVFMPDACFNVFRRCNIFVGEFLFADTGDFDE